MGIAALITWVITAVGGFVMLGRWIAKGGAQQPRDSGTRLPPAVVFSHLGLAAVGLLLWIIYVATDNHAVAWIGFILLLPVVILGFVMLARWLPTYRARGSGGGGPPERHFPVAVVAGHGVFAVATLVLSLLAAMEL